MNMTIDELKNYPMPRVIPLPKWSKAAENSVICLDGSWKVTDKKDGAVQQVQVPFDMGILHKKGLSQHSRKPVTRPPFSRTSVITTHL